MRKIRDVLRLKYELGFTHRTIAKALHVAVGTVSEYLAKAKKDGLSWPLPEELSDGELEAGLFPPPGSSGARPGLDFTHIHEELRRHRVLFIGLFREVLITVLHDAERVISQIEGSRVL